MAEKLIDKEADFFFHTFHRLAVEIDRCDGVYLYSKDGKQYIDFFGGLAVNALGYNNPRINAAIEKQVRRYIHLSNYFLQDTQIELAEKIIKATGYKRIFFSNSGTEAVEGAIKLARKWGQKTGKTQLLNLTNSFHGRTMGALSMTDRPQYRKDYDPFLPNTDSVQFNNVDSLKAKISESTLGFILESIQGEGGINVVSREFADELSALQKKHGFLLIADEIQAGMGRTGKFFGFEHIGLQPDIVVIAKAVGGGLPLGAILGNEKVADVFGYGEHGTTFGGNPVACAAGCAVMDEIVENGLMKQAGAIGDYIKSKALELQKEFPSIIKEVRGRGCMLGIEIDKEGQPVVDELMNRGIMINCTNKTVLRMLPPYIMPQKLCDQLMNELRSIFKSMK
ncbi:MAG: acetylornithine/succinylornithine family transaminase [Bacteroidetes bacterium]|nr:acetylornithine/succinylornithine family transaminase [Bacteroidota bacterium]